jgi:L-asparaginase
MTKILIIYTGGTIGMVQNQEGILVPFDFENITSNVPELGRLNYIVDVHSFDPILDSSNMNHVVWLKLVSIIESKYNNYDGFVILHGSDTMAYTASALSFLIENLTKPIILTGSQLPIGEIRTDAKENLITSIEIAASRDHRGKALVPEVCIYFDYQLMRGNRSKKVHADKFEAFMSPNYPILAEAGVKLNFYSENVLSEPELPSKFYHKLNNNIASLKIFPGISPSFVNSIVNSPDIKAIIIEGFGTGNTNTDDWFIESLRIATEEGKILYDISQCLGGSVDIGRYETSKHLERLGVISGYDITFESAITKLMFVLANYEDEHDIKRLLSIDIRGELNVN